MYPVLERDVGFAAIQPSHDVAVAVFTNLGGVQDLRHIVAGIALRIAARYSADGKVGNGTTRRYSPVYATMI